MNTFENIAYEKIHDSGFADASLATILGTSDASLNIDSESGFRTQTIQAITDETHSVIYDFNPYGVSIDDPSMMVRRKAQAVVLGKGFAVFGIEVSNPRTIPLNRYQRQLVSDGSFSPYAHRAVKAMESIRNSYGSGATDARQVLYGFSMGADVAAETTSQLINNQHLGIMAVDRLGAFDPARTGQRGKKAMAQDFANSGPDLFDEVIASEVNSLLEARQIYRTDAIGQRNHIARITRQVIMANMRNPRENLAVLESFGTDQTTKNLLAIGRTGMVKTIVGRMGESTVCLTDMVEALESEQSVICMSPDIQTFGTYSHTPTKVLEYHGYTHAAADNLIKSAGFLLSTVMR